MLNIGNIEVRYLEEAKIIKNKGKSVIPNLSRLYGHFPTHLLSKDRRILGRTLSHRQTVGRIRPETDCRVAPHRSSDNLPDCQVD